MFYQIKLKKMIDRSKFFEPTPKFITEFPGETPEKVKDWFNADLIYIAVLFEDNKNDPEFVEFYEGFIKEYECEFTIDTICEQLKDFNVDIFNELMTELMTGIWEEEEE